MMSTADAWKATNEKFAQQGKLTENDFALRRGARAAADDENARAGHNENKQIGEQPVELKRSE